MLDFLKKLYQRRKQELTFLLLRESDPEPTETFQFRPQELVHLILLYSIALVLVVSLLFMFTPIGQVALRQQDQELRQRVLDLSHKMQSLTDSLDRRDQQMQEIKQVLVQRKDTVFNVNATFSGPENTEQASESKKEVPGWMYQTGSGSIYSGMEPNMALFSKQFEKAPSFPAPYPASGTLTRGFNPEKGHYGIDIAAREQGQIKAVANGSVTTATWTASYGYVIELQHANGVLSVYKHCSQLFFETGDIVRQGDVIGTVGNAGALSSGPHLHFEIWINGVPVDPRRFLVQK